MTGAYVPIEDHGIIGNLQTAALVALDGSIDWCCLPELDSPSVFGALLDGQRGGRFRVGVAGGGNGEQAYLSETNVLETRFRCPTGVLRLTDFMPVPDIIDMPAHAGPPDIHRMLNCEEGHVWVEVEWSPRFDYARSTPVLELQPTGAVAREGNQRLALGGLQFPGRIELGAWGPRFVSRFQLGPGQAAVMTTRWDADSVTGGIRECEAALRRTRQAWRSWSCHNERLLPRHWARRHAELVGRSEMVLKLLHHAESGAIAAAPTTSLPEVVGGPRNWDYRFSWIRDASRTCQALIAVGHPEEAMAFLHWIQGVAKNSQEIQILYGLHPGSDRTERELPDLAGYRGSRPVRIGNAAASQVQLDTYGEILGAAYELVRRGESLDRELEGFLCWVADQACLHWEEPDHGIWEFRTEPRHFVLSKAMVWLALDRAVRLAEAGHLGGEVGTWKANRTAVRRAVLEQGYNPRLGSFVQSFGSTDIDAATLMLPMIGFLPAIDPRIQGTVDRVRAELFHDGLLRRYLADDSLSGKEGAFVLASFWLVEALALAGRLDEAEAVYEGMARRANHVGLYAEEIDPQTGAFLGNFPQAFSHLGLVNAAVSLAYADGTLEGQPPLGSPEREESGLMKVSEDAEPHP